MRDPTRDNFRVNKYTYHRNSDITLALDCPCKYYHLTLEVALAILDKE